MFWGRFAQFNCYVLGEKIDQLGESLGGDRFSLDVEWVGVYLAIAFLSSEFAVSVVWLDPVELWQRILLVRRRAADR
jgi:hypothetical protein